MNNIEKELLKNYQKLLIQTIKKNGIRDQNALQDFIQIFYIKHLNKKEHFVDFGEVTNRVGYIIRGIVRAYYNTSDGREYTKTLFVENDFLAPLTSIVTNQPSLIAMQALTHVDLLVSDYKTLESVYSKHHELECLGRKLIEFAWADKEKREIELMTLSAEERYNLFLNNRTELLSRIPHHYIASCLGITPVALSRIRSKKKYSQ